MSVYVISAEGTPRVKIGWAKDPAKRLKELQTGSPYPLTLLHSIDTDDPQYEREAHKAFKRYQVQGEWFELTDKALNWLCKATPAKLLNPRIAKFLLGRDLDYAMPAEEAATTRESMRNALREADIYG